MYLHQWERALDLAVRQKTHVDTMLACRVKHLERCDKEETLKKYQQYMNEVEVDWDQIAAKLEDEFLKEKDLVATNCRCVGRAGGGGDVTGKGGRGQT